MIKDQGSGNCLNIDVIQAVRILFKAHCRGRFVHVMFSNWIDTASCGIRLPNIIFLLGTVWACFRVQPGHQSGDLEGFNRGSSMVLFFNVVPLWVLQGSSGDPSGFCPGYIRVLANPCHFPVKQPELWTVPLKP